MPRVIGVVGTAKNTGKTTTILHLLRQGHIKNIPIALVGIGYDGEDIDNVTRLPKPRIFMEKGMFVATSEKCLELSTAELRVISRTGFMTPLGEVVTAKIEDPGLVVVSGPNQAVGLRGVIEEFSSTGVALILIDGSINRIIPLMEADVLVFATGASRNSDISKLTHEMKAIHEIFRLPEAPAEARLMKDANTISILSLNGEIQSIPITSIYDSQDIELLNQALRKESRYVYIPGIVSLGALKIFASEFSSRIASKAFIFPNAGHILAEGHPCDFAQLIPLLESLEIEIRILRSVPLAAVTINPFYARWSPQETKYISCAVNKKELERTMSAILPIPVFNIKEGASDRRLFELLTTSLC